ncbi:MAG: RNA methyltransferase [Deltaproteobacteria bacterium]|nr:RNA methyltransferase [Deltaproteobacteria bacterium]
MTAPIYIALIHYPVRNKEGKIVTTSVTNFDLHDLARTARTYGIPRHFIVTPNPSQQDMARYIKNYWIEGKGAAHNPDRRLAFEGQEITATIEECRLTIQKLHGNSPRLVATTAQLTNKSTDFKDLKGWIQKTDKPFLILFGTGWGLEEAVLNGADFVLAPICGPSDYNHLPVRAAVAIVLDRLLGQPS